MPPSASPLPRVLSSLSTSARLGPSSSFFLRFLFFCVGLFVRVSTVAHPGACLETRWLGAAVPASSDTPFLPVGVCAYSRMATPLCSSGWSQNAFRGGGLFPVFSVRIPQLLGSVQTESPPTQRWPSSQLPPSTQPEQLTCHPALGYPPCGLVGPLFVPDRLGGLWGFTGVGPPRPGSRPGRRVVVWRALIGNSSSSSSSK